MFFSIVRRSMRICDHYQTNLIPHGQRCQQLREIYESRIVSTFSQRLRENVPETHDHGLFYGLGLTRFDQLGEFENAWSSEAVSILSQR